jgi:hypothetical protein
MMDDTGSDACRPSSPTHRALESTLSEKDTGGRPSAGWLLLIPAVAIAARAATRHHRMLWAEVDGSGAPMPFGPHGRHRFAGRDAGPAGRDAFRLPPRIEWMLDTWHARAHAATAPSATADAPVTDARTADPAATDEPRTA